MTAGRAFQSAARFASFMRPAMQRSAGSGAFNSFLWSSVRASGVLSSSSWSAQYRQPSFPVSQPTYGFAAQGLQMTTDASDSSTSLESGSSSATPSLSSAEDSECLANPEDEGVIPRKRRFPPRGPPWLHDSPLTTPTTTQPFGATTYAKHVPPAVWARPPAPSSRSCTGVIAPQRPLAAAAASATAPLATVSAAVATYATVSAGKAQLSARAVEPPAFTHPSRPGHAVPASHQHPEQPPERLSPEAFREKHGIQVDADDCPEPLQAFSDGEFPQGIMEVFKAQRYSTPSAIQAQAWPVALAGRDVVAIASTGSGKTLGFLLPALMHIQSRGGDPAVGPSALVLAPTRELARQIQTEAERFQKVMVAGDTAAPVGRHRGGSQGGRSGGQQTLRTACLYGGAERRGQYYELRRMPHLIIATPGRLRDFLESGEVNLSQVSYLVLDEADRMLDMGFEPQIMEIARALPRSRQTLFFSATWPEEVRAIADRFARQRPVHIFIGDVQEKAVAARTIRQRVQIVEGTSKPEALGAYLQEMLQGGGRDGDQASGGLRRAIVFCKTKAGCEHLAWIINNKLPFQASSLHGDKSQAARDFALAQFRSGRVPVLVATDVAARGLDIPNITAVVNYDMPDDIEMYVHRIGRTGRAGASGDSLALVTPREADIAKALVTVLEGAGQEVPKELVSLAQSSRRGGSHGGGRGGSGGSSSSRGGGAPWGGRGRVGSRGGRGFEDGGRAWRGGGGGFGRDRHDGRDDDDEEYGKRPRRHHADGWRSGERSGRR